MYYAKRGDDGAYYVHHEDGGDGYLTPLYGPMSRSRANRLVRRFTPKFLRPWCGRPFARI